MDHLKRANSIRDRLLLTIEQTAYHVCTNILTESKGGAKQTRGLGYTYYTGLGTREKMRVRQLFFPRFIMPRIDIGEALKGAHPMESAIADVRGVTKGRVLGGIVLGLAVTAGLVWVTNTVGRMFHVFFLA